MPTNLGNRDRIIRGALGLLVLIAAYFTPITDFSTPAMYYAVILIGIVLVGTAVLKSCIVYRLLGISTSKS